MLSRAMLAAMLGGVVGCGRPAWPLGVPAELGLDDQAQRAEAPLPLCNGQPSCPEREALKALLEAQARRCAPVDGSAAVPADLEALLAALSSQAPSTSGFPRSFEAAPTAFREAEAHAVVDARAKYPEASSAVPFHAVWWTFWDRGGISDLPTRAPSYTHLIAFTDFEGRKPCEEW